MQQNLLEVMKKRKNNLKEVLITGGDPLMSIPLLSFTIDQIKEFPNISIIRIASRVPFHDPERINDNMLEVFSKYKDLRFELGNTYKSSCGILGKRSVQSIKKLQSVGFRIYNQNPLLRGVNDDFETLAELYSKLRDHDIESHYLFHAVPLRGMSHHRTSVKKGIDLTNALSSCESFQEEQKLDIVF